MRVLANVLTEEMIKREVGPVDFMLVHTGDKKYKVINLALVPCGFDIECYKQYMYIWTLTIRELTIIGYTWDEFKMTMKTIQKGLDLFRERKTVKHRDGTEEEKCKAAKLLPIYIHNFKYEWSFMRSQINVTSDIFFMDAGKRDPMYFIMDDAFWFIDSYKVYPLKLEEVAKCYCKTRKTHDLDYDKPRNIDDAKALTEKELDYCCNDTIILSELMQHTFDSYLIPYGRMPMTQNQIIKSIINSSYKDELDSMIEKEQKDFVARLKRLSLTQDQYKLIRRDGFRGGYVNSSECDCDLPVGYGDLTSAYCTAIIHEEFPMTKYMLRKDARTIDDLDYYADKFCCQMRLKIYGLRSSGDKLVKLENTSNVIRYLPDGRDPETNEEKRLARRSILSTNSGRIFEAGCIVVSITDVDWKLYKKVYEWDKIEILEVQTAVRGPLPDYIKKAAIRLYGKKAQLKKAGIRGSEYFSAKTLVSNIFGAMVQRRETSLVNGKESDWWAKTLDSQLKAQWGVYVTAHVRKTLVETILAIGKDHWLYSDTDSIYYLLDDKSKKVMEEHNARMKVKNAIMCKEYGLDYKIFDDLGCWDDDGKHIKRFKTIGPKAYLYITEKDELKLVLAGIPEEFFWKAYSEKYPVWNIKDKEKAIDSVFAFFEPKTEIKYTQRHLKFVENTDDIINGMPVHCDTGCYIDEKDICGPLSDIQEIVAFRSIAQDQADGNRLV